MLVPPSIAGLVDSRFYGVSPVISPSTKREQPNASDQPAVLAPLDPKLAETVAD
jgi:hypothetical protein